MTDMHRRRLIRTGAGLCAALAVPTLRAQPAYPAGPIRIVITVPAGGGHDTMMRLVGTKLTEAWGQPCVVESKPGASGAIAASFVARSAPDGLTMLLTNSNFLSTTLLQPSAGYRTADFVPVSMQVLTPIAIGVRSSLGVNTIQEWVAMAKRQPGKLTYGSYGQGSGGHFVGEQLNAAAGIESIHVPYKGEAPAIQDVLGGQIDAVIASLGGASRHPGKIKALAIASPSRFPVYGDVPTFAESGLPDVNMPGWGGVFLPVATPRPIVDRLAAELNRVIMLPDVQPRMLDLGFEPVGWAPPKLQAFLDEQLLKTRRLVDAGRVKL
ncbi:tripartite tricarboxylate transporter substrate binding protein [Piscinibacter sakaiensis]|uniref:Putative exported protein n=1 Tax=Piscinibacter sakaiensis TaxID=1547922 RepID=A0A0K8P3A0_PISS1|nr:tripartite tricarboxylate transporter substrate binding protein [Piscinibacter sakaiensis]GAP37142.1 putative exported protein [Piscinibacter sakaiensis]